VHLLDPIGFMESMYYCSKRRIGHPRIPRRRSAMLRSRDHLAGRDYRPEHGARSGGAASVIIGTESAKGSCSQQAQKPVAR
jgi:hypothetical protein